VADARLTGSDKRSLLFWIALGILGIVFAQKFYFRAFPEASVNFKVTRQEALNRAKSFVASLGENVSGYQSTAVFSVDDQAKVYLERELGLQQANNLMSGTLNIWYWDIRSSSLNRKKNSAFASVLREKLSATTAKSKNRAKALSWTAIPPRPRPPPF